MDLVKRKRTSVIGRCEHCGREMEVPGDNLIAPYRPAIELKSAIRCQCGEYHNLIAPPEARAPVRHTATPHPDDDVVRCPYCGSSQYHAGDKGFSLGKAAAGGVLVGPVGLLGGLLGSKKTVITCLKCGRKWEAGRH
ncbi:MAG: hypothetical protein ACM3WU_04205 [Bacillota bacterium]